MKIIRHIVGWAWLIVSLPVIAAGYIGAIIACTTFIGWTVAAKHVQSCSDWLTGDSK